MRGRLLTVGLLLGCAAAPAAVEVTLSTRAVAEAIDIGLSRLEANRARFHQPYRIPVGRAPVDYVEVVTPFRRVVAAAETRARMGDRMFGQREALAVLAAHPGQIDLVVELTFHPHNTYVGVPAYDVRVAPPGGALTAAVDPLTLNRLPRFGPRLDGTPLAYPYPLGPPVAPGSEPLTGGALLARVDGSRVAAMAWDLVVLDAGKELARARIDFRALR